MMDRRGPKGEGSLFQRSDGKWVARTAPLMPGVLSSRKAFVGSTRGEAVAKRRAFLAAREPRARSKLTLNDFTEHLLRTTFATTVRPKTFEQYEYLLRCHLLPAFGSLRLTSIASEQISALLADKRSSGLSTATVAHIRRLLRRIFNLARKAGILERNPVERTDPVRIERRRPTALKPVELQRLLSSVVGKAAEGPVLAGALLGLRLGEAVALKWEDIDFERGTVSIRRSIQRIKGGLYEAPPKTEAGMQTLPMPVRLLEFLCESERTSEWCFPSSAGGPQEPRNVARTVEIAVAQCGLPKVSFHALRHSCATLLIAEGVPLSFVQQILRHSSIQVTKDIYGHLEAEHLRAATAAIDRVLRKAG